MRVGIIGINHKLANLKLRELLAKACQRQFVVGGSNCGDHTFILLSTCNRTEVYFFSEDLAMAHTYLLNLLRQEVDDDFDQKIYSYFGHDCFLHLSRVTAGLDSAIVAETEIQGQVKTAYEIAAQHIQLPGELHFLFQKALNIGKKVRSQLSLGRGMPGLEHAIFGAGIRLFSELENVSILFIGASEINQKILRFLKSKNLQDITICNRSLQRAQVVAEAHCISVLDWSHLSKWQDYHWVICGTKSPNFLLNRSELLHKDTKQKLLIDLSVPRNIDPRLGWDPRITLLNIDGINRVLKVRKQQMSEVIIKAEELVAGATQRQIDLFHAKNSRADLQLFKMIKS